MKTVNNLRGKLLLLSAVMVLASQGWADDKKGEGKECIPLTQIRETKAIDDQTIIVYGGANQAYKNQLPNKCNGLRSADSYMYKTSESRLCSLDVITILNRYGGSFSQGASCGLGKFERIDRKTADDLVSASR
jgi:hypothetical protein